MNRNTLRRTTLFSWLVLPLLLQGCGSKKATIAVDFSSRPNWQYAMTIQVNGSFIHGDTAENFSNSARCNLKGAPSPKAPASLEFSLADVAIASTVVDTAEIQNLTRQFESVHIIFSGATGDLLPVDSAVMPAVHIGGWDLYHTMARLVPSLPQTPVAVGATWERDKQIPLQSSLGNGIGHLYQSFTLDSLFAAGDGKTGAAISWKFSYRVELAAADPSAITSDIPLIGSGTGTARFNVTDKILLQASINFAVPRNKQSSVSMEWSEKATLRLAE